jgi:hypothetical protein
MMMVETALNDTSNTFSVVWNKLFTFTKLFSSAMTGINFDPDG